MTSPDACTTSRSSTLRNWRTLPGHGAAINWSSASLLNLGALDPVCLAEDTEKVIDQRRYVVRPFTQRWNLDVNDIQTIKKIFAEFVRSHSIDQPAVGCGDDANVDDR